LEIRRKPLEIRQKQFIIVYFNSSEGFFGDLGGDIVNQHIDKCLASRKLVMPLHHYLVVGVQVPSLMVDHAYYEA
jgi:hypothetical protein